MDKEFRNNLSIRNVLIVGDGDYSFSVAFLMRYGALPITVTATTLEQGILMEQKYPNFAKNLEYLESHGCTVIQGVDATALNNHFESQYFTHIIFNFPHVGGKSNIKKNRQLLDSFLKSASHHIDKHGAVLVTLCKGQGGTAADRPKREWYNSWQITAKAANSDLILISVDGFEGAAMFDKYLSTGFRSQNKRFNTEGSLVHKLVPFEAVTPPGVRRITQTPDHYMSVVFRDIILECWDCQTLKSHDAHIYGSYNQIYCPSVLHFTCNTAAGEKQYFQPIIMDDSGHLVLSDSVFWYQRVSGAEDQQHEQIGHLQGDVVTLDLTKLLTLLLNIEDVRCFSSLNDFRIAEFCLSNNTVEVTKRNPDSIYPPEYRFDISFWLNKEFSEDRFYRHIYEMSNHLVREVKLIDTYTHSESNRVSHCYCLMYQSLSHPLSYSMAYQYYQHLRDSLSSVLKVELR